MKPAQMVSQSSWASSWASLPCASLWLMALIATELLVQTISRSFAGLSLFACLSFQLHWDGISWNHIVDVSGVRVCRRLATGQKCTVSSNWVLELGVDIDIRSTGRYAVVTGEQIPAPIQFLLICLLTWIVYQSIRGNLTVIFEENRLCALY